MEGDDEELSFIHIAAATANVVRFLQLDKKQQDKRNEETKAGDRSADGVSDHRAVVNVRVGKLNV